MRPFRPELLDLPAHTATSSPFVSFVAFHEFCPRLRAEGGFPKPHSRAPAKIRAEFRKPSRPKSQSLRSLLLTGIGMNPPSRKFRPLDRRVRRWDFNIST